MTIIGLLQRPLELHENKKILKLRVVRYDATLQISLPRTFLNKHRGGWFLSDKQIISINKLFEERFEEDLYRYCVINHEAAGTQIKESIQQFAELYNIVIWGDAQGNQEDITYQSLRKKEYRFRISLSEKQKIPPVLSHENLNKIARKSPRSVPPEEN